MTIPYEYVAYIDEAGDPGLERVRPIDQVGGTEWLTIGCALIKRNEETFPTEWIKAILADIGIKQRPDLHFRHISPTRRLRTCDLMSELPARYFVVCSNKKNMRRHKNDRAEAKSISKQWFYNWCIRILLERVTDFVKRDSIKRHGTPKNVKFVFSKRGGHSYTQTAAYHALLKVQSSGSKPFLNRRVPVWEVMDYRLVEDIPHSKAAGLQLADVVASSFYYSIENLDTGPCSPEPAKLLKPKMAFEHDSDGNQCIADFGVVLQPTPDFKAPISDDQREIFRHYGYTFEKRW